jgi:hypothetical protein
MDGVIIQASPGIGVRYATSSTRLSSGRKIQGFRVSWCNIVLVKPGGDRERGLESVYLLHVALLLLGRAQEVLPAELLERRRRHPLRYLVIPAENL